MNVGFCALIGVVTAVAVLGLRRVFPKPRNPWDVPIERDDDAEPPGLA